MITRAKVIANLDDGKGYKWAVNIPILNGIPDNVAEYESYKADLNIAIKNNEKLAEDARLSTKKVAEVTQADWSEKNAGLLSYSSKYGGALNTARGELWDSDKRFDNKVSDFTTEARVCGIGGIQNYINVGDTVYVGFEDNDMGRAVILGLFLSKELEDSRSLFLTLQLQNLKVSNSCDLPIDTDFIGLLGSPTLTIEKLKKMEAFYDSLTVLFGGKSFLSIIQGLVTDVGNMKNPPTTTTEVDGLKE